MITLQLNGEDYTNFDRAAVFRSMENASGAFTFESSADSNNLFPVKRGDSVKILVDGEQVLDGFIEEIRNDYSSTEHTISVIGRDKLADLIDSTITGVKEFTGATSLVDIAKSVLNGLGLSTVDVIDSTDGIEPFTENDITSAEVGKGAFDFLELYARKRQVLLSTDGFGNLVMQRASTEEFPARLQSKVGVKSNNVKSASLRSVDTERFNRYVVQSQLNPFNLDAGTTPTEISNQNGQAIDGDIRGTRVLELNSEESNDSQTAEERANWEANIRRARSLEYSPVVQGHGVNGTLWKPNVLVPIDDDFADIHATMLLKSVRYEQTLQTGSVTTLTFTYKDAYTLQAEQDAREATTDSAGFFS